MLGIQSDNNRVKMKPDSGTREKSHSFFKRFQEYANQVSSSTNGIRRTSSLTALEDLSNSKVNLRTPRSRRTHKWLHRKEIQTSRTMSVEELNDLATDAHNNNNIQQDFEELQINPEQLSSGNSSEQSDEREFRTPRQRQNNVLNNYMSENTGLMRYNSTGTLDKGNSNHVMANGGVIGVKKRHNLHRNKQITQDQKINNGKEFHKVENGSHPAQRHQRSAQSSTSNIQPWRVQSKTSESTSYIPRSRSLMELRHERSGSLSYSDLSNDAVQNCNKSGGTLSHSTENISLSSSSSSSFRRGFLNRRSERGTSSSSEYISNENLSSNVMKYKTNNRHSRDNFEKTNSFEIDNDEHSKWDKMKQYDHTRRQHNVSMSEDNQKRSASSLRAAEDHSDVQRIKSKDRVRSAEYSSSSRRPYSSSTKAKHSDKENIPQTRSRTRRALPQLPHANSTEVEERRKRISAIALERVQRGLHALRKEVKQELDIVHLAKDVEAQSAEVHDVTDIDNTMAIEVKEFTDTPRDSTERSRNIQDSGKDSDTSISNRINYSQESKLSTLGVEVTTLQPPVSVISGIAGKDSNPSKSSFTKQPHVFSKSMDNFHSNVGYTNDQDMHESHVNSHRTFRSITSKRDTETNEKTDTLVNGSPSDVQDLEREMTAEHHSTHFTHNTSHTNSYNEPHTVDINSLAMRKGSLSDAQKNDTSSAALSPEDIVHSSTALSHLPKSHSHEDFVCRDEDISKDAIQKLIHDLRDAANKPINDANSASHSSIPSVVSRDRVSSPEVNEVPSKDSSSNESISSHSCGNNHNLMQASKSKTLTVDTTTEKTISKLQNRPPLYKISQTCDFVSLTLRFKDGETFATKYSLAEAPYYEAESAKAGKYIIKPPVGRRHTIGASGAFAPVSTSATPTSVELSSDGQGSQLYLVAIEVKGQGCLSFKENQIWDGDFLIEVNNQFIVNLTVQECLEHLSEPSSLGLVVARPKTHPASTSKGDAEAGKECEKLKFKFDSIKQEAERNLDAIADLKCSVQEKDNHIRHLEEKYRNFHGQQTTLEVEIKEKDAKVMEWMLEVNRRDIEMSRLKVQLKLKDDKIAQLRKLLIQQTELMELQGLNGYVNQPDFEVDGEKVSAV